MTGRIKVGIFLPFHFINCYKFCTNKDALNQWGSIVALTYIAAQRTFPNYNDMADNKAYLESIARSFGYFFGKNKKVRVNTISQSPTRTTAGQGVEGLENFFKFCRKRPLHLEMPQLPNVHNM